MTGPGPSGGEQRPRVWVVGSEGARAALAAATERFHPVGVDLAALPPERPAAVVLVDADPSALGDRLADVRLAVAGDVDAAAYEAGADAVVPVDPAEEPGPLVAWLERAVGRDDERFERTLERVDDAVFALDDDWRFTYLNEAGAAVINAAAGTDLAVAELRGRHIWDLIPDAVDTQFYEEYHAAMARQEVRRFESQYEPLGTWFEVRAYPSPEGLSVHFSDVTERRRRETALRGLVDTARALLQAADAEAVAECLADAGTTTLGFDAAAVRGRADGRLELVAAAGEPPPDRRPLGLDSPPGRALRTGEPVVDEATGGARDLYVPIADHCVLCLRRTAGELDGVDRRLSSLLAAVGEAAFDRVERARELRRYEAVLETARGMVFVVDDDRQVSLVTEPLADRLGYDRADLVGRHVSDLIDEDAVETTGAIREALLAAEDGSHTFDVDVRAADGERVPIEIELTSFDDGVERGTVGVVTDRSALRAARSTLATERERLTYLFENLPNPAVEYDVDPSGGETVVRSVNPAFCETFGVDRDGVVGTPLATVLPDYDPDESPERLAGAAPGETVTAEVDHTVAGDRRRFRFSGVSFRADDRVRAFGVYTDVTDARRRERYFRVVARVLRHNLRNELNVLLSHADRIRAESPDGSVAAETAERIASVVDDLAALSEDAHDLARVVEGGERVSRATVDLAALGRSAAAAAGGPVETDLPDRLDSVADPRIDRAVAEVVENALEHAPDGGPRIEAVEDGDWVGLRVVDDGPGIPETERAVIAGEREITQTDHASGLGLWLARWLVEDAGGRLEFESPESGTSVALWFPRA